MTLDQLSAAATQGELYHCGWGDGSTQMGMTNIFNEHSEVLLVECIPEADAAFIVALWNTYRTGQLVAVADDAVERVKPGWDVDGICNDHGVFCCQKCATPEALAAMKDTQP